MPAYLRQVYWWAYVHPGAVRLFERQWLTNAILLGNFARLREAAFAALAPLTGRTLQVACVYGDLTPRLAERMLPDGRLDVADVLPIQLQNLRAKLPADAPVGLHLGDSTALPFASASYDRALLFFLLHEQPAAVRRRTLAEAWRVVRPGGRIVMVDYLRPSRFHPLRRPLEAVLRRLEPYALDLWREEVASYLPTEGAAMEKQTYFGGLYQRLVVAR